MRKLFAIFAVLVLAGILFSCHSEPLEGNPFMRDDGSQLVGVYSSSSSSKLSSSSRFISSSSNVVLVGDVSCMVNGVCVEVLQRACEEFLGIQVPSCLVSSSSNFVLSSSSRSSSSIVLFSSSSSLVNVICLVGTICAETSQSACDALGGMPVVSCPVSSSSSLRSSSSLGWSSSSNISSTSSACTAADNTSTQYCSNGTMKQYGFVTYEGQIYKTIEIDAQTWMAENLNYYVSGSKCYNNSETNCTIYGRLYNWSTAMNLPSSCNSNSCDSQISAKHRGICPAGWHIPSSEDWNVLMRHVNPNCSDNSDCANAGTKLKVDDSNLWNYNGNGTDEFGFSALHGGFGNNSNYFNYVGIYGKWWSTSDINLSAYVRGMQYDGSSVFYSLQFKSDLYSVRCIMD
jgi:uncharacterized protein (TIGR02145 family)